MISIRRFETSKRRVEPSKYRVRASKPFESPLSRSEALKIGGGLRRAELRTADALGNLAIHKYQYALQSDATMSSGAVSVTSGGAADPHAKVPRGGGLDRAGDQPRRGVMADWRSASGDCRMGTTAEQWIPWPC